jgi:type I restriction enzyme S subunit
LTINAWEKRKLGELIDHKSGKAIEKYFDNDGALKVISIGSYGLDNRYVDQGIRAISNTITQSRIINKNELAMVLNDKTANGSIIGRTLLIQRDREYVANQRTEIIHPKDMLDSGFTYFALNGIFRNSVKKIVQGGTQIYVNFSAIALLPLKIPTLSEQKKIQDFFKILTHLIAATQDSIEALGQAKKALLQHLFDQSWRFKGYSDPWEKRELGEIFNVVTDYVANGSFKSLRQRVSTYSNPNFAYMIRLQDASNNWKGPWLYTDQQSYSFLAKTKLHPGDILMSNVGSVGKFFLVPDLDRPMTLAPNAVLLRSMTYSTYFLFQLLQTSSMTESINEKTTPGVQQKINKTDFKKIITNVPTLNESSMVGQMLFLLDNLIAATQSRLSSLESLKKSLLQDLFI